MDTPNSGLVPGELYRQFIGNLPLACVDILVRRGAQYLLIRRKDEPLKGQWWVPGGRILKGETAKEAAARKLKAETGIETSDFKFVGYYEDFYERSAFEVPCHSISLVYETTAGERPSVELDKTSDDFKWSWNMPHRFRFRLQS